MRRLAGDMRSTTDIGRMAPRRRLRGAAVAVGALLLVIAAVAQSTAALGAAIPWFAGWSTSFYGWQSGLARSERAVIQRPTADHIAVARARATRIVREQPLTAEAWRVFGLGAGSARQIATARPVMQGVDRITRRDPAAQSWLIDDAIRAERIPETLRHFDTLLRTEPEARRPLLARMAGVLDNAAARRDLAAYVDDSNIWYAEFAEVAGNRRGSIIPYAQLLVSARALPGGPAVANSYRQTVERLVGEGQFRLLAELYPKLPQARREGLASLSFDDGDDPLYPPVGGWVLADEPDRGGSIVSGNNSRAALEAFADPLTSGVVARRLIWPPAGARTISWRIIERERGTDATATLNLRCLDAVVTSGNLLAPGTPNSVRVPQDCPVAMVEISLFGGTGRDPSTLVLEQLSFGSTRATVETR